MKAINATSLNLPEILPEKSTAKSAKDGGSKNFKIMDISKDRIVLRETKSDKTFGGGYISESLEKSNYKKPKKEQIKTNEDSQGAFVNNNRFDRLSRQVVVLDSKDIQQLESDGKLIEQMNPDELRSSIDNLLTEKSSGKNVDNLTEGEELSTDTGEEINNFEDANDYGVWFDSIVDKMMNDIAKLLNIPFSGGGADIVDLAAKKYLVENDMPLTVGNIYKALHCGSNLEKTSISDEDFGQLREQVENIINDAGLEINDDNVEKARWLIDNDIPLDLDKLNRLEMVNNINDLKTEDLVEPVLYAIKDGIDVNEIDLSFTMDRFESIENEVSAVTDDAIGYAVDNMQVISISTLSFAQRNIVANVTNVQNVSYINENNQEKVSNIHIQLDEIRLMMSYDACAKMSYNGVDIRTQSISSLVEQLKDISDMKELSSEDIKLNSQVNEAVSIIKQSSVSIVAKTVSVQDTITLRQLHTEAVDVNKAEYYETLMTKPRKDMGDSINKAFSNIKDILEDVGLEDTAINQRAVRILAYNSMHIDKSSIENIKHYDMKVTSVIEKMTPRNVVTMIKDNINPYEMKIDDLSMELSKPQYEKESYDDNYGKFLWELDNNKELSAEERESFVGIFRLVNAVKKSDGAVIGAAVNADMELTLSNLLTNYRSRKAEGMDINIDDNSVIKEQVVVDEKSISYQINRAFAERISDNISPEALKTLKDERPDFMDMNIELVSELLVDYSEENEKTKKEYQTRKLEDIRQTLSEIKDEDTVLSKLGLDCTINNLAAVLNLENDGSFFGRKKNKNNISYINDDEDREALSDIADNITDNIVDKNSILELYNSIDFILKNCEAKPLNSEQFKELTMAKNCIAFSRGIARNNHYTLPMMIDEDIVNINLTVVDNGNKNSQVQVSAAFEKIGTVKATLSVNDSDIKGFVVCETRKVADFIKEHEGVIRNNVGNYGMNVNHMDYMVLKEVNSMFDTFDESKGNDNRALYDVAKALIVSMKEMEEEYEN
ncbi:MAG: DUF6240 domain-containing protein [Lachnospiraceae bacterium]|nr:DUF6240 domain-containing protein [Lachnospiraceae bacterium]